MHEGIMVGIRKSLLPQDGRVMLPIFSGTNE
jgi:hypothetical protein